MDARSVIQWIVAVLVILGGALDGPAFADISDVTYGGDFNLPIPSDLSESKGWMEDAVIIVPESFLIGDIDVALGLTHGAFFDLAIILQSPAGTSVVLNPACNSAFLVKDEGGVSPVGGSVQWSFDDEAGVSIEQATEPYTGPYCPVEFLSAFDGENAIGEWRLRIEDACYAHTGELESAELIFKEIPEPATLLFLAAGAGLAKFLVPRRRC